jgi:uncharacterized repeat protein (TIGR02543 family)
VVLTAQTSLGTFAGWTGCTTTAGPQCTVSIGTADVTVTANFTAYRLAINKLSNGGADGTVSSTDTRIDCGTTCLSTYNLNDTVTLNAVASVGGFTGWSSTDPGFSCTGVGSCQVTMSRSRTVTANFTAVTLTVARTGSGTGTIDVVTLH